MKSKVQKLLSLVLQIDLNGNEYIVIENEEGKLWVVPKSSIAIGLNLFNTSNFKTMILKKSLPCFYQFLLKFFVPILSKQCFSLNQSIVEILEKYKLIGNYAWYIGDTSFERNEKIVQQISLGEIIVGYGKYSCNEKVIHSFQNEVNVLRFLKSKGIDHIPSVLGYEERKGFACFYQSTERLSNEKPVYHLTENHLFFIDNIISKTSKVCYLNDSNFLEVIFSLKNCIYASGWKSADLWKATLEYVDQELTKSPIKYCFFHGDFTPWNICYKKGHIFVFDFEYCKNLFPAGMDLFHFITQVGILVKNDTGEKIYKTFIKNRKLFDERFDNSELIYLCYLLFILNFYMKRWENKFPETDRSARTWIEICTIIRNRLKY